MRWHTRFFSLVGILSLLIGALSSAQEKGGTKKEIKIKPLNYYPLEVGNTWYFNVSANGEDKKISTKISKHEKVNGLALARLQSPDFPLTEDLVQTEKGVFRHRFNGAEITPPLQLLPYPPKAGLKWKGEFAVQGTEGKHAYDGEIQAEEMVEVPAGKFKAMKVMIKLEENGLPIEIVYWFAQDVGFVRQTADVGGTKVVLELEKFERKK